MSGSRIEDILREIAQLPQSDRNRLRQLLDQRDDHAISRDRAASLTQVPDSTRELQWLVDQASPVRGAVDSAGWRSLDRAQPSCQ